MTTNEKHIRDFYRFLALADGYELRAIKPGGGCPEFQLVRTEEEFFSFCTRWSGKAHVFCGIAGRNEQRKISQQTMFFVDLDEPQEGDLLVLQRLAPECIISSGTGFHAYFRFLSAISISDGNSRDRTQHRNACALARLRPLFQGKIDPAVSDPERIARVPGTINLKNGEMASIVYKGVQNAKFQEWYNKIKVEQYDSANRTEGEKFREGFSIDFQTQCSTPGTIQEIWTGNKSFDSQSQRDYAFTMAILRAGFNAQEAQEAISLLRKQDGDAKNKGHKVAYLEKTVNKAIQAQNFNNGSIASLVAPSKITFTDTSIFENIKQTEWLINDLIPKSSITFLVGDPKTGKSYFALEAALAVSLGRKVAQRFLTKCSRVLFLELEDGIQVMAPRFHALTNEYGQRPTSEQFKIYMGNAFALDKEESYEQLLRECDAFQPGLVVVDTLARCHNKDEINAKEMTEALGKLIKLRNDYGCALLILHHFNKASYLTSNFGRRSLRGSSVIEACAESIIRVQRLDADSPIEAHVRSKVAEDFGFSVVLKRSIKDGKEYASLVA